MVTAASPERRRAAAPVMKILTADQFRHIDQLTAEKFGTPQLTLMERAGARVAETIEEGFGDLEDLSVVILCGKGNNGGDGYVVARLLMEKACRPRVYIVGPAAEVAGDAAVNLDRLRQVGVHPVELLDSSMLPASDLEDADIIVDAMLGTGLKRPAEGLFADVIKALKGTEAAIVSIDVPSGLATDQSDVIGPCVEADLTVTFTALKACLVFPPANTFAGDVVVVDIGNPDELVNAPSNLLNLLTAEDFPGALHRRPETSHKGDYGKVLIVGGSRGKSGAAIMAGQAALRSGAGLVTVATPSSILPIVAASTPELMTEPLAETDNGGIADIPISQLLAGKSVFGIGPGAGTHPQTQSFIRHTVQNARIPTIIDADGLNAFAGHTEDLHGTEHHPVILTPHPGEMARLIGKDTDYINTNRVNVARDFATSHRLYVVLKGFRTVIAAPDGSVYVNSTGNPGMATGGMGDILTGMIAGVLAQEKLGTLIERLCFAVYLHGLSADLAAEAMTEESLIATDLLRHIGAAWEEIRGQ
jgi:NAD(P)H-hydrate epimerase